MDAVGRLEALNVGSPREVEWHGRTVRTAIWKAPIAGRLEVRGINVDGDEQADRRVHGGPDKAVYAYAVEDYRWWSEALGQEVAPATFGENLTTSGVDLDAAVIGERWHIGSATLEVCQPRLPCFKLGVRMGDAAFVDRFDEARRYGAYLRIIEEGSLEAGDVIHRIAQPDHGLRIRDLAQAHREPSRSLLDRVLATDEVPDGWKSWARKARARASH